MIKAFSYRLIIAFHFISCAANAQQNSPADTDRVYVSIIRHDNQNPFYEYKTDTLVKDSLLPKSKVDLYLTNRICHFPYYMPSCGMMRNACQDKECDMGKYPSNVKCYQYDSLNRVVRMQVEGSGTMGYWFYKYDSLNRVIEIKRDTHTITMIYNSDGTLAEIRDDNLVLQKQFYFVYRKATE